MNLSISLRRLATDLSGATSLVPGETSQVLTDAALLSCLMRACVAYSHYRPVLRRLGDAQAVKATGQESLQIEVVGGLFRAGDAIVLDFCGPGETTALVESVTQADAGVQESAVAVPVTTLTLTQALSFDLEGGALIVPEVEESERGLTLTPGRSTYGLPLDFLQPDQDSFDLCVGARSQVRRSASYYDAAYGLASALSGVGYGYQINSGLAAPGSPYPVAGNPYSNPNGGPGQPQAVGMLYRFALQGRPTLTVSPPPAASRRLDFYYQGVHIPASVPVADQEAVLAYARYAALQVLATHTNQILDATANELNMTDRASNNVEQLRKLADAALAEYEKHVRFRPLAVSG